MNPVFKIINNMLIAINRLIDSMSLKTVESIKRGFYFFTFLMCIAGIIIGYNMGTKSAKIKRPPLAEFANDTFKNDINREKDMGSFDGMIESEKVSEAESINSSKIDFFVRERLNPEKDNDILNPGKTTGEPDLDEKVYKSDSPIDDNNTFYNTDDERIKPLDRKNENKSTDDMIFKDKSKENNTEQKKNNTGDKTDIRMLEKGKTITPKTIQKDQGTLVQ